MKTNAKKSYLMPSVEVIEIEASALMQVSNISKGDDIKPGDKPIYGDAPSRRGGWEDYEGR